MFALRTTTGLNRIIDEAFSNWPALAGDAPLHGSLVPPVDIIDGADEVRIMAELPGVKPEDVKITFENDVLTIRGEKQQVRETANGDRPHRFERSYGVFERSFTVPATVDAERAAAHYEHGVLTVSLPRAERAKPRQIEVKVS